MKIVSTITNRAGEILNNEYIEGEDPNKNLEGKILQAVHAYCFYNGKLVLVYASTRNSWTPPGGGIEAGETYEAAVAREVMEESNMKVLKQELIGYIDIREPDRTIRQVRSFCLVEPYGEFTGDTDKEGEITKMMLIDPVDYKMYFNWGEVGDHIMKRAMEMFEKSKSN